MHYYKPEQVITLVEALNRIGFPIGLLQCNEFLRKHAHETFVAWTQQPTALLNPGGEPFAFCSGAELFSFGRVQKNEHGNWWATNQGYAVVVDVVKTVHQNPPWCAAPTWTSEKFIFKLVEPC